MRATVPGILLLRSCSNAFARAPQLSLRCCSLPIATGAFLPGEPGGRTTPRLFDQVFDRGESLRRFTSGPAIFEKAAKGLVRELNDPYSDAVAPGE